MKEYLISEMNGLNQSKLHAEILASESVENFVGLNTSGDTLSILGDSLLDETALDGIIQNHVAISLDDLKQGRIIEIDIRTAELIGDGFTFDGNSFSLSHNAQLNWLGLRGLSDLITFPTNITTRDDGEYSLSLANLDYFVGTALGTVKDNLDSGRDLKVLILEATTIEELNEVVDTR